jgi:hypothetical protein
MMCLVWRAACHLVLFIIPFFLCHVTPSTRFYNTLWSIVLLTPLTLVLELSKLPLELSKLFTSSLQMWLFVLAGVLGCVHVSQY